MNQIELYTRVIIAVFGFAYPILLQVIARLDEKYSSVYIVDLFDKEKEKQRFIWTLYASMFALLIWTFSEQNPPIFISCIPWINVILNWVRNNYASAFVLLTGIFLVIFFFFYVRKIIIYYTPIKFINYQIEEHKKRNKIGKTDLRHFRALSDVLIYTIQKSNYNLSKHITFFFYDVFGYYRHNTENKKPVLYPEELYMLVNRVVEELAINKSRRHYELEERSAGSIWLLGELKEKKISQETFNCIWRN